MDYLLQTKEMFREKYNLDYEEGDYKIDEEDLKFCLPSDGMDFYLCNGYWCVESYNHYCQLTMHQGEYFWLREAIFSIAEDLGQHEVWHAQEFYTWNGGPCLSNNWTTFENWVAFAEKQYGGKIPEFDSEQILMQGDVQFPDCEPIYHDTFKDILERHRLYK